MSRALASSFNGSVTRFFLAKFIVDNWFKEKTGSGYGLRWDSGYCFCLRREEREFDYI
jgi:hypothetical protein